MATFFILGQLFGGQLFELFARETNLKKQSSVRCTGSPLIVQFLGPRKKRTNGNPYY